MKEAVPADLDLERADRIVARLAGLSRRAAKDLIERGAVIADGSAIESGRQRLPEGAMVEWEQPVPEPRLIPEAVEFGVPFEDRHLAVIDKPAGLVTHPGAGSGVTLAAGVLHRWPGVSGVGEQDRWGIVHRLDKDTSGLLVVALSEPAYDGLKAAISKRAIEREYLTLVRGEPVAPTGAVDAPLGRDPGRPTRIRIDPAGRPSRTRFEVVSSHGHWTLLRVKLETGRTHQIRVHLASIGLPIAGDAVYGTKSGSPRVFLHSARLRFDHPVGGDVVEVASGLPDDLAEALAAAG